MKWIKHKTDAWDDEKLAAATCNGGLEIYGFYWRVLEIIGKQMDETPRTSCQYSPKVWGRFCGISAKKFQKLADILESKKLISINFIEGELLVSAPNLLKIRDEYSKKKINKNM